MQNAHTILEAAQNHLSGQELEACGYRYSKGRLSQSQPGHEARRQADQKHAARPYLMLTSANDAQSLRDNIQALHNHVSDPSANVDRLDLAYTLGVRRSKLFHRGFSVLGAEQPLASAFTKEAVVIGKKEFSGPSAPRVGFILTGQGAQRPQMGRHLIEQFPSVCATLGRLDSYLAALPKQSRPAWTFADEFLKPDGESRVHDPRFAQPLTCAMQIAVINLLAGWGILPSAGVVGHSSGEIPAAYAAGFISERQAITIAFFRGFSVTSQLAEDEKNKLWAETGMLAVGLGREKAQVQMAAFEAERPEGATDLVVACDNSPESVTISGAAAALDELAKRLTARGIFARRLRVTKAYHNPTYMGPYSHIFKNALENAKTFSGEDKNSAGAKFAMYSSVVEKEQVQAVHVQDAEYWRRNMEGAVLFNDALHTMLSEPASKRAQILIEIGPSAALKGPVRQILSAATSSGLVKPDEVPKYVPTLIGGSDASEDMLRAAGSLFTLGYPVDMRRVNALESICYPEQQGSPEVVKYTAGNLVVDLPNYAWNKTRAFWHEPRASRNHRFKPFRRHEILGSRVPDDNPLVPTWRNFLSLGNTKWLPDHKLHDDVVFPAAGYISMAAEAALQFHSRTAGAEEAARAAVQLRNVHVRSALVMNTSVNPEGGVYTFLTLTRESIDSKWYEFTICSQQPAPSDRRPGPVEEKTDLHCYGQVAVVSPRWDNATAASSPDPVIARIALESEHWTGSRVSGRTWYRHFSRIGFNYTSSFQVISHVRAPAVESQVDWDYVKDQGPASEAILQLPAPESLRSRYIVSPAVIDGLMQTLLATNACGKPGALQDLCVPTKFDSIYLAPLSATSKTLRCLAHIIPEVQDSEASKNGILGTAEAFDESGELVVAMEKLACTKIEGTGGKGQDAGGQDLTHVHKIVWKPDVTLLGRSGLPQQPTQARTSSLAFIFDLLGHHDPAATYLEINAGSGQVTTEALSALTWPDSGFSRFTSYTFSDRVDDNFAETKERLDQKFPATNVTYKTLSIDEESSSDEGEYDVVVARLPSDEADHGLDSWFKRLRSLLKMTGRLVLLSNRPEPPCATKAMLDAGLDALHLEADIKAAEDEYLSRIVVVPTIEPSKPTTGGTSKQDKAATIEKNQQIADTLSSILAGGVSSEATTVSIDIDDAIIVLAGLYDEAILVNMDENTWSFLTTLIAKGTKSSKPVIWLSRDSQLDCQGSDGKPKNKHGAFGAMIAGLSRVLGKEEPELVLATVDIDSSTPASDVVSLLHRLVRKLTVGGSPEREFAIRHGTVLIQRIVPDTQTFTDLHPELKTQDSSDVLATSPSPSAPPLAAGTASEPQWKLVIRQVGLLQTLNFVQVPPHELAHPLGPNDVEVDMCAVGVNFKDVAICMGILPHKNFGLEFAGVITRVGPSVTRLKVGQRVAGLPSPHHGAYRSRIRAPDYLCFGLPDDVSFEEGATMPCVFFTVIHSLIQKAHMRPGQRILIHSAAGGVGLAAIQLARHLGASKIYATCGAEEKRRYLIDVVGLDPACIFSSRSASFQRDLMRTTRGRGVDVVLNSLSGDLLDASWSCVSETGCMVDVSRVDFLKRNRLQMRNFCLSASFYAVDASIVMTYPDQGGEVMRTLQELIDIKAIQPLKPMRIFALDELEAAFRLMQSGKSHGKLVISRRPKKADSIKVRPCSLAETLSFDSDASTYLLIGCLGGIGRSITRRMFDKGARSFIMLSPSGDRKPAAKELVDFLRGAGAVVTVIKGDVSNMNDVQRAMAATPADKPLRGIVHSAMVLHDAPFSRLTPSDFRKAADPKVRGAYNLHQASLSLPNPKQLDFFVVLSSVSGVFGQFGQSAYASANTYLDALAAHRHSIGLAATSLDLGFVEDVGWTTENEDLDGRMAAMGILAVRVKEVELLSLIELEMLRSTERLRQSPSSSIPAATSSPGTGLTGFECPAQRVFGLMSTNSRPPKSYQAPRLRALLNTGADAASNSSSSGSQSGPSAALLQLLKSKAPAPNLQIVAPLALETLSQKMSDFLLVPVEDIDAERSPESVGVDSLVAVELRTWLRDGFGVGLSTMEILKAKSFRGLAESIAGKLVEKYGA